MHVHMYTYLVLVCVVTVLGLGKKCACEQCWTGGEESAVGVFWGKWEELA